MTTSPPLPITNDNTTDIQLPTAAILIFSMTAYVFLIFVIYLIKKYLKSNEMCIDPCRESVSCSCNGCYECLQMCDCGTPSCDSCSFCPKTKLSIVDICLCHCLDTDGCCRMGECNCERGCENIRCGCIEISIRNTTAAR